MILGDACRQRVVESAHRLLRPGGRLILHVHNRWFSVWDSAGRRWLLVEGWRRMMNHLHAGDRPMPVHQGVAGLSLHHFTRGEAVRLLVKAGFRMLEVQPVGLHGNGALAWPQFLPGLRAYGYLLAGLKVS
jgi:SAM-dependent methyltransferase